MKWIFEFWEYFLRDYWHVQHAQNILQCSEKLETFKVVFFSVLFLFARRHAIWYVVSMIQFGFGTSKQ